MTQSIATDSINTIDTMLKSKSNDSSGMDFANVLNSKLEDKVFTLGDMKNNLSFQKVAEKLADFKDILMKAAGEVNVENSLDLTLAKDIDELVTQLKEAVGNSDEPEENSDAPIENMVVFEQILTSLDKTAVTDSENNQTENTLELESVETELLETELSEADIEPVIQNKSESLSSAESEMLLDEDMLKELNIESIEADTDSSGGDSLMRNQTPQEQAVKIMINNDTEVFDIKVPAQPQAAEANAVDVTPNKIIEQITKQMETLQNTSKLNIVLNPEALGKITIQLVKSPEGLSAQFTTTTQEARDLLMKGMDGLKDALTAQGVGVENVSVKLNNTQESSYNQDWTEQEGSRGGNKEQGQADKGEKDKEQFEKTLAQQNKEDGNV